MKPFAIVLALATAAIAQQTPAHKQDTTLAPPKGLKTTLSPGYRIPTIDLSAQTQR